MLFFINMKLKVLIPALVITLLAAAAFFIWENKITAEKKPAKQYFASPLSCAYKEKVCSTVSFTFTPSQKSAFLIPQYTIKDDYNLGKSTITFQNTNATNSDFLYSQVINNPLIQKLDYFSRGNDFVVIIDRNGPFLPTQVIRKNYTVDIILNEGDGNFPKISDQKPPPDSTAYISNSREISFMATLNSPLKKSAIMFQNEQVFDFATTEISQNEYIFTFNREVLKDKEYSVKVILTDDKDRTTVSNWIFEGKTFLDVYLGPDRFKYLGWWGQISLDGISIRKEPSSKSEKLGALSSINTVKVLKEVEGENIDGNNIWYQIDGGKYPGAYIFSEFVFPMPQPQAPENFSVPNSVAQKEYWIDVDLTKKMLTLFLYDKPIFSTYISIGREENPTATGTYAVWYKLTKARMKGGPPLHSYKYDLTDVPYVMYYNGSYAIHGTYWHDKFGSRQSAGCTNMTQGDAKFIFSKTNPQIPDSQISIFSSETNPGTVVSNHY
jgi:lipoprotein-anchoring transpeptidase ErfK/SrfK